MKFSTICVILVTCIIIGCAGNTGRLYVDGEVTDIFESYQVLADHHYYYSGPDFYPRVIIGVQNDFTLEPGNFWKPVQLSEEQLRHWLNFPRPRVGYDFSRRGRNILGPDGERIGIWYPVRDWKDLALVRLYPDNKVSIGAPMEDHSGTSPFSGNMF
ncbi:MAG: hypothetical protein HKM93_13010 [Desulfobacteraceae bacterium]|nr:hypothetical protein [Desulfobacteraceae bacterium]